MANVNMIATDNHPNMKRIMSDNVLHKVLTEEWSDGEPTLAIENFNAVQFADGSIVRCVSASEVGYIFLDGDIIAQDVMLDFLSDGYFILVKM